MSHLLIIDDDPLFRTLLSGVLKRDHRVVTAADGHEGYQLALADAPKLVLLDLMMPTWDGVATMRAFRADQELSRVPVLILTGLDASPELDEVRAMGAASVLPKSAFSGESLRAAVTAAITADDSPIPHFLSAPAVPVEAQRFDN